MAGKAHKVVAAKGDGSSSSLKPSQKGKPKKLLAPLKPIDEHRAVPDDIRAAENLDEEVLPNPRETIPLFPE